VIYLALIGSVLAFTAYVWLLQNAPISQVSTYAYVNPVVAVLLGALLLGEQLTTVTMVGGAIILLAVALVIRAESLDPPREAETDRPQLHERAAGAPVPSSDCASRRINYVTLTLSRWRMKASRSLSYSNNSSTRTSGSPLPISRASTAPRSSRPSTDDHHQRSPSASDYTSSNKPR
jgi:hypothetical protein